MSIFLAYQTRWIELQGSAARFRSGQLLAFGAMAIAIAVALVLAFFAFTRRTVSWPSVFVPLPVAAYCAWNGKKQNASLSKTLRLANACRLGMARLDGSWPGTGFSGSEFASGDEVYDNHVYQRDLHVFGEGSLFELLCTCRTEIGRRQLAKLLLEPPGSVQAIRSRQVAIQELQGNRELQDGLTLLGKFSFEDAKAGGIAEWLETPVHGVPPWRRSLALLSSAAFGALLLLAWDSAIRWQAADPWLAGLLLFHAIAGLVYRRKTLDASASLTAVDSQIRMLRLGLELIERQEFQSPLLIQIQRLAGPAEAGKRLRHLERLASTMQQRNKEWFYLLSRALLVGTQTVWTIENWRVKRQASLRQWLTAWGEFEALTAVALYADEHPADRFPALMEGTPLFSAKEMKHPLLPPDRSIGNDVLLDETTRFYVLSGSNMAGKSTFIRALGLNAVLAYCGAPVAAEEMILSRFSLCASLSVEDSLLQGKSKFMAEMDRLRQAIALASQTTPVLFLIDEILSGTNSEDRRLAAEAIVRILMERGAMGVLSTHDLALTELAHVPGQGGLNVHMCSRSGNDPLDFDYKLKPGPNRQSSAAAIARMAGVPI